MTNSFSIKIYLALTIFLVSMSLNAQICPIKKDKESNKQFVNQSNSGFTQNVGQVYDQNYNFNSDVKYLLSLNGLNVSLKQTGFSYDVWMPEDFGKVESDIMDKGVSHKVNYKMHRIDMEFVGCNQSAQIITEGKSEDFTQFYSGKTKEKQVKTHRYLKVTFLNIYPGIDVEFVSQGSKVKPMEYNFIVHPGADLGLVKIHYTGANSAILKNNTILLNTVHGNLVESIPASWLVENNQEIKVQYENYAQSENSITIGFSSVYNKEKTLVIDPTPNLDWGTYFGGSKLDISRGITTDKNGNVFVTGLASSTSNISTTGSHQSVHGGNSDVFISKFTSSGSLSWATYMGGTGNEEGYGICTDTSGNIFITGHTSSNSGISTPGAFKSGNYSKDDVFISKFTNDGTILWSTYFGTFDNDYGRGICTDESGNVFITGYSDGNGIGSAGSYQRYNKAKNDAFLAKFNSNGTRSWSTYFGGLQNDYGYGVSADKEGNVVITGLTNSASSIATSGAYQTNLSWENDAFLAKFSSSGSRLWSTYYGSQLFDAGYGVATDKSNNIYMTGVFSSGSNTNTNKSAFVLKFNKIGTYLWYKHIGAKTSSSSVYGRGICIDSKDNVIVAGQTYSDEGISTFGAHQITKADEFDAFVVKLTNNGDLFWGTYYGGDETEDCHAVCTDSNDNVYISGYTESDASISTQGAYQTSHGGAGDGFIARFSGPALFQPEIAVSGNNNNIPNGKSTVDFADSTNFGETVYSVQYKITNKGPDTLRITDVKLTTGNTADFSIGTIPSENINPFDSTYFTVKFNASTNGVKSTKVQITSNDIDENPFAFAIQAEEKNLSFKQINFAQTFFVYPNPSTGMFTLEWERLNTRNTELVITSVSGQVIYSENIPEISGQQSKALDLCHLPKGIYFLQFNGQNIKLFIK